MQKSRPKVINRNNDLPPITQKGSVLDVKGIDIDISREEILSVIKEIRERDYGYRKKHSK